MSKSRHNAAVPPTNMHDQSRYVPCAKTVSQNHSTSAIAAEDMQPRPRIVPRLKMSPNTKASRAHARHTKTVSRKSRRLGIVAAALALAFVAGTQGATAGDCCSKGAGGGPPTPPMVGGQHANHSPGATGNPYAAIIPQMAPHGGQVATMQRHDFEVVYTSREIRIYIYSPARQLLSAQGVRGDVVMQVRGNPRPFRYPVRAATDDTGLSCLSLPIDLRRIRDGDMQVTFALTNLPIAAEPRTEFTQTFALTQQPAAARVVALPEEDRSTHFPPPAPRRPAEPRVVVAQATAADAAAIRAQGTCPVMKTRLGGHGQPIKLLVDGKPLFVCCKGCIQQVKNDPQRYLANVGQRPRRSVAFGT